MRVASFESQGHSFIALILNEQDRERVRVIGFDSVDVEHLSSVQDAVSIGEPIVYISLGHVVPEPKAVVTSALTVEASIYAEEGIGNA